MASAEVGEGVREPKKVHNLVLPRRAEMDLHMLTHVRLVEHASML